MNRKAYDDQWETLNPTERISEACTGLTQLQNTFSQITNITTASFQILT